MHVELDHDGSVATLMDVATGEHGAVPAPTTQTGAETPLRDTRNVSVDNVADSAATSDSNAAVVVGGSAVDPNTTQFRGQHLHKRSLGSSLDFKIDATTVGGQLSTANIPPTLYELSDSTIRTSAVAVVPGSGPSPVAPGPDADDKDLSEDAGLPPMTCRNPPKNLYRLIAGCAYALSLGLSDGAPGALLNHMETYYDIGYAVVSLIWLGNSIGFIIVALCSHRINVLLGRHLVITFGCSLLILMYSLVCWGPPFPLLVIAFFIGGIGMASVLTQHNMFLSRFSKADVYLGYFHGMYGCGATIAPLIATAMVSNNIKWSYYYFVCLFMACVNAIFGFVSFDNCANDTEIWFGKEERYVSSKTKRKLEEEQARQAREREIIVVEAADPNADRRSFVEVLEDNCVVATAGPKSDVHAALHSRETWIIALFTFFYQGGEVALGGWIDTFLIKYRGGDPNSTGYVASGYWGGLCLGRFILTPFLCRMGPKLSVSILCFLIIVLDILVWTIPSVIPAAVCVSLVGVAMGPIYPLLVTVTVEVLPRRIQLVSMTLITAFGSTGGALFPFLVGIASQLKSTYTVHPFCIALTAAMLVMWLLVPSKDAIIVKKYGKKKKRTENAPGSQDGIAQPIHESRAEMKKDALEIIPKGIIQNSATFTEAESIKDVPSPVA